MSRSKLPHRTDTNHAEISSTFEKLGCSVFSAHAVGAGFPDLVVGCNGHTLLVEIKTESGKLTDDQIKFIQSWNSTVYVVRNNDDVVSLVNHYRAVNNQPRKPNPLAANLNANK